MVHWREGKKPFLSILPPLNSVSSLSFIGICYPATPFPSLSARAWRIIIFIAQTVQSKSVSLPGRVGCQLLPLSTCGIVDLLCPLSMGTVASPYIIWFFVFS